MKIKHKMILIAVLFSTVPVFIASVLIGSMAVNKSVATLENSARDRLISLRDVRKEQITEYISTIEHQIQNLSGAIQVKEAMSRFSESALQVEQTTNSANVEQWRKELSQYYLNEFGEEFKKRNPGSQFDVSSLYKKLDPLAVSLQYQYIQKNPHPLGSKDSLINPGDGSDYAKWHEYYHPFFQDFLQRFGYYDIFLVDQQSGRIVYSVFKELDYATSLKNGPYANSGIGKAFEKASQSGKANNLVFDDFKSYLPSYQDPAAFMASPIIEGNKQLGVIIFQMPIDRINTVMTQHGNWKEAGLGLSGETYLVGPDKTMRSISRFLIEDKGAYIESLKKAGLDLDLVKTIEAKGTSISLKPITSPGSQAALAGEAGFSSYPDYRNKDVYSAYTPINIAGENWAILAEIDKAEALQAANTLTQDLLLLSIGICAIIAGLSIVGGIFYARSISKPVEALSKVIQQVESNSDLTLQAEIHSKDELGVAATAFNAMVQKFHSSLQQVTQATDKLGTIAQRSSTVADQANTAIQVQVDQTNHAASAMSQMDLAVKDVSQNIHQTSSASNEMNDQAAQGRQSMKEANDQIESLVDEVEHASSVIGRLESNSEEIGKVLDVIRGIAEQTNLLALNAAIEAARAGEQGRGFAVVADEVRTLASRTSASTEEINTIIETLQHGAKEAVNVMDQSREKAKVAKEKAGAIDQALGVIAESIDRINGMSTDIATAAEEQSMVASEINTNFEQISSMTQQTAEGIAESSEAGNELKSLVGNLQTMVGQFKV